MHTKDNRLNIIHISDTHICKQTISELREYKNALVKDIKSNLSSEELKSSLICFTGDLISRGDYGHEVERQYSIAMDEFVLPLLIDLELEQDCFYIVPGNHEIDLTKINDIYDNGLKDRLKNYNGVIPVKYKDEYILKERLEGFRAFERELIGCSSEEIVSVRQKVINDKKVGFCLINTS